MKCGIIQAIGTARLLIGLVLMTVIGMPLAAWADTQPPITITIDQSLHFQASDGTDVVTEPGEYEVKIPAGSQIQLQAKGKEPVFVQAVAASHGETVDTATALVVADQQNLDLIHVLLLQPDGQFLDAVGSVSGVQTRATTPSQALTFPTKICVTFPCPSNWPSGWITTPKGGTVVKGKILIDVYASATGPVQNVQILVDGNPGFCALEKNAPYTCNWDTRKLNDGSHILSAVIRDTANNAITVAAVPVMVQNQGTAQVPLPAPQPGSQPQPWQPGTELFTDVPTIQGGKSFALPPDKQAMMGKLSGNKTTKSLRLIAVNTQQLNLNMIGLPLRQDLKVRAARKKVESRALDNYTWFGSIIEQPGDAILVVRGQDVTGTIRSGKDLFRLIPLGGGNHALVQIEDSQFPPDDPPGFNGKGSTNTGSLLQKLVPPPSLATVDVLVAYTSAARDAAGGVVNNVPVIASHIQLAEDESNQSFQNSGVNVRFRVVGTVEVNYAEGGQKYRTILDHFKGSGDGYMDEIHALRDRNLADVAVIVVDQKELCGQADVIGADKSSAFAAVHWDCLSGNLTFAHEIGHLMGARHDTDNDPTPTPFSYGHGYRIPGSWRTIMAYPCDYPKDRPAGAPCPKIPYWSNPRITHVPDKGPMGDTTLRDNARVLNEAAASIAQIYYGTHRNGEVCTQDSDCVDGACYPFPPTGQNFCIRRDRNCALPGTDGAFYKTVIGVNGIGYQGFADFTPLPSFSGGFESINPPLPDVKGGSAYRCQNPGDGRATWLPRGKAVGVSCNLPSECQSGACGPEIPNPTTGFSNNYCRAQNMQCAISGSPGAANGQTIMRAQEIPQSGGFANTTKVIMTYQCQLVSGTGRWVAQVGAKPDGQECSRREDCQSSNCAAYPDGKYYCLGKDSAGQYYVCPMPGTSGVNGDTVPPACTVVNGQNYKCLRYGGWQPLGCY